MYTLKLTICVLLAAVAVRGDLSAEVMAIVEDCANKFGVSMEDLKNKNVPEDKKCMSKCIAINTGVMSEDGTPLFDVLKEKMIEHNAPEDMIARVDGCRDIKMDDACDTAKAVYKCVKFE